MQTRLKHATAIDLFSGASLTILLYIPNGMIALGNTIWICGRVRDVNGVH